MITSKIDTLNTEVQVDTQYDAILQEALKGLTDFNASDSAEMYLKRLAQLHFDHFWESAQEACEDFLAMLPTSVMSDSDQVFYEGWANALLAVLKGESIAEVKYDQRYFMMYQQGELPIAVMNMICRGCTDVADVKYYLALTYYAMGDSTNARNVLPYVENATEALDLASNAFRKTRSDLNYAALLVLVMKK